MSDQEISYFQETQEQDFGSDYDDFLHPTSASNHHPSPAVPPLTTPESFPNPTYGNYCKLQSPSSFQESSPNRTALNPAAADHHLFGFKRLQLPHCFPSVSPPPLRNVSEPIPSAEIYNAASSLPSFSGFPNSSGPALSPPLQEISKIGTPQESSRSLQTAQGLYRTVSDPAPLTNRQVEGPSATPPSPTPAKMFSGSPSCGESPSTKRLKKMKERLREMNQWWNQVMSEGEEEDEGGIVGSENCGSENISKEELDGPKRKMVARRRKECGLRRKEIA